MQDQSRNFGTVADKMKKLAERYPLDKYVWIMPKLDTAGALPEHLDFMVSTRKFSIADTDNDVYPINAKSIEAARQIALSKNALMALAADAGIKWIPGMNRRTDDGSNPDVVEWQATGILTGLSGMTPVTATKRVDLDHLREKDLWKLRNRPPWEIWFKGKKTSWNQVPPKEQEKFILNKVTDNDMQRKEFKVEMAETKAQLRVIRSILGIPSKFDKATIATKEFAVLRVIFAPNAQTPEERKMILSGMMNTYLGAFPGAEKVTALPSGETSAQVEAAPIAGHIEERTSGTDMDEPLPAASSDIQDAEVVGKEESEPDPDKPPLTKNFEFLGAMGNLKRDFIKLLGKEDGQMEYYKAIYDAKVKHANEITDPEKQESIYDKLSHRLELVNTNVGRTEPEKGKQKEPAKPKEKPDPYKDRWKGKTYGWLMKARVGDLLKKKTEELNEHLIELSGDYDLKADTLKIKKAVKDGGNDADLIEACIRLLENNLENQRKGGRLK